MNTNAGLKGIQIRTELQSGDIGKIVKLHGSLYQQENGYGLSFESYVAKGLSEFYAQYDPDKDRVWVAEHQQKMVGFLLLMHRPDQTAQLRYFLITPEFRGIGLGKHLVNLYMTFLKHKHYQTSYLWTTHEQQAAIALYRKYGFRLSEEKTSTAFGKLLTEQRFDLKLGPVNPNKCQTA